MYGSDDVTQYLHLWTEGNDKKTFQCPSKVLIKRHFNVLARFPL